MINMLASSFSWKLQKKDLQSRMFGVDMRMHSPISQEFMEEFFKPPFSQIMVC